MQSFFNQVTEVDEACLQQRQNVYAVKTRVCDPFTAQRQQANESDALHQAQLERRGHEQPECSTSLLRKKKQ